VHQSRLPSLSSQERPSLQVLLRSPHPTLRHRRLTRTRRPIPIPRPGQLPDVIGDPPPNPKA